MTKYILNSGGSKDYPDKEKLYIQEILKDFDGSVRILYCFFAQVRENWEIKYEKYQKGFLKSVDEKYDITFELAFPDQFEEQCSRSDVILVQGGDDHLLQFWLNKYDLPKIWDEKVVATSSAGSSALVNSFWTCDWRKCLDGAGIIPIRFIPHYKSPTYGMDDSRGSIDWEEAYEELKKYGDTTLPIHALEEGDYIVIKK